MNVARGQEKLKQKDLSTYSKETTTKGISVQPRQTLQALLTGQMGKSDPRGIPGSADSRKIRQSPKQLDKGCTVTEDPERMIQQLPRKVEMLYKCTCVYVCLCEQTNRKEVSAMTARDNYSL